MYNIVDVNLFHPSLLYCPATATAFGTASSAKEEEDVEFKEEEFKEGGGSGMDSGAAKNENANSF